MKIIKIDNCSNCPYKVWDRRNQKRICRHNRANRTIETAVTTIPDWCELEDEFPSSSDHPFRESDYYDRLVRTVEESEEEQ